MRWVIGIDEAGRGPLAGPIAVGVVALPAADNVWKYWKDLKDSKQLSETKREWWLSHIKKNDIQHAVALVGSHTIDTRGIVYAARLAAARAIKRLSLFPDEAEVLLDKNLSVPNVWKQEQFIKGDERIPAIALASIVAKVTRDRYMIRLARSHPHYSFEVHKGYGTKAHYAALKKHGVSNTHRRSFLP